MEKECIMHNIMSPSDTSKTLEIDSNGYYHVILGSLNGAMHCWDTSNLEKRMAQGCLYGEVKRPAISTDMSVDIASDGLPDGTVSLANMNTYYGRYLFIDLESVSHIIKDVSLTQTSTPSGDDTILVEGWVKPTGPHGATLKAALEDPVGNVKFGIRAYTRDKMADGVPSKKIVEVITWDLVIE